MFPYLLCADFETSGTDVRENKSQPISCGLVIIDTETLETLAETYIECQFYPERFEWSMQAQNVHGLSQEHLSQQSSMEEAAGKFLQFITPYFKSEDRITLIGHNPHFDKDCLDLWMNEISIKLKYDFRRLDTFSIGYALFGATISTQLFDKVGVKRSYHNALEDAQATVEVIRLARKIGAIYLELLKEHEEGKL